MGLTVRNWPRTTEYQCRHNTGVLFNRRQTTRGPDSQTHFFAFAALTLTRWSWPWCTNVT